MLHIEITHLTGEKEILNFEGDVSFIIARTHTRVLQFKNNGECEESNYYYELGTVVTVSNWHA